MPDAASLHPVSLQVTAEESRLALAGTVNIMLAEELLGAARRIAPAGRVEVDLAEAEHLDTSALQVLLVLREAVRASGGTWAMGPVPDRVRHYLRLAGLEPVLLCTTPS